MCFETKKGLRARDERRREFQTHLTQGNFLKDVVFLSGAFEFRDVFKIEIGARVVFHVHLHVGSDLAGDVHVDVLIEIEARNVALTHW